jgi:hypothetical protein
VANNENPLGVQYRQSQKENGYEKGLNTRWRPGRRDLGDGPTRKHAAGTAEAARGGRAANSADADAQGRAAARERLANRDAQQHRLLGQGGYKDIEYQTLQLARQNDDAAGEQLLRQNLRDGGCIWLKSGDEVFMQDSSLFSGIAVCLRPRGKPSCYFVRT